jgi:AAHS family 4-hydroxybenzoate transporter-like MFS transporter
MMLSVGRVGAILGPFVAGELQQIFHGPTAMFLAIGAAALVAACAIGSLAADRLGSLDPLEASALHG